MRYESLRNVAMHFKAWFSLVCYTAVSSVVTQCSSPLTLRDIADDPASLVYLVSEAIETIVWKLPIVPVVWIVSKFFGQLGRSGKFGRSYENLVCYTAVFSVITQSPPH